MGVLSPKICMPNYIGSQNIVSYIREVLRHEALCICDTQWYLQARHDILFNSMATVGPMLEVCSDVSQYVPSMYPFSI